MSEPKINGDGRKFCIYCRNSLEDSKKCQNSDCNEDSILKWNYQNTKKELNGEISFVIAFNPKETWSEFQYDKTIRFHESNPDDNIYKELSKRFSSNRYSINNGHYLIFFETIKHQMSFIPIIPTSKQHEKALRMKEIADLEDELRTMKKELKDL
jgi:hypothetical protein